MLESIINVVGVRKLIRCSAAFQNVMLSVATFMTDMIPNAVLSHSHP